MTRGFVIMATGAEEYLKCANTLAKNIQRLMPDERVSLITDAKVKNNGLYDKIIKITNVDDSDWQLANDYLVYDASPYDETIKLESDIYLPRRIDHWWDILADRDLNICTTIRDRKNNITDGAYYRKTFIESGLVNTYNAITYFKKSPLAERFYAIVRDIFQNWNDYVQLLKFSTEDRATTDVVYALAARIIGEEQCTMTNFTDFSMIHMKQMIANTRSMDWTDELVTEIYPDTFRVATIPQLYPVHYQVKSFAQTLDGELDDI